jgi:hypothetical protein
MAAFAVTWFSSAAAAEAAPPPRQMAVTVSPSAIVYPAQTSIVYVVEMTAGTTLTSFGVTWSGPAWPGPLRPWRKGYFGSPLVFGTPQLEGPGTLTAEQVVPGFKRDNFVEGPCIRGGPLDAHRLPAGAYRIDVPANESTTLAIPAFLAAPPRPSMSYATVFAGTLIDPSTFVNPIGILGQAVPFQIGGLIGPDVDFKLVRKRQRLWQLNGRSPALRATSTPAMPNRTIQVRAISTGKKATRPVYLSSWRAKGSVSLGTYVTDSQGRFTLRSRRMPSRRYYRIMARYDDPGPGLAPDWSCGPPFNTWPYDP